MILAIDQGTTGTTCIVFDEQGRPRGRAYSEFEQYFPKPGWVEHDAAEIWDVTRKVAVGALADAAVQGSDLKGIGITNQRETVVAWDPSTGEPVHRALVWQDRRTAARCDELREQGQEQLIRERTGLVIDPYFSGTKIEWLIKNADLPAGVAFGTIDSWLVFKLTGRHLTDYSNASRTLLFDIRKLAWDEELCGLLGVDPGLAARAGALLARSMARPRCSAARCRWRASRATSRRLCSGRPASGPGETKNTYGTGSFVLLNTGAEAAEPEEGLLTTVAWGLGGEVAYALEAAVFVTGAAVQWLRDGLRIITRAAETEALAASLESNDDVYFVPALTGLGSPHWDPYARGTIVGLTRGATRAHLARAALEAIAYQTVDAVRAQEAAAGERIPSLKADGGAVANRWLMQFQADVLGVPVIVPEVAETTALGAAYLAGIATGEWTADQVREMWREQATYEPAMPESERDELVGRWREAVARARGWATRAE